jgi:hypothetical protein
MIGIFLPVLLAVLHKNRLYSIMGVAIRHIDGMHKGEMREMNEIFIYNVLYI